MVGEELGRVEVDGDLLASLARAEAVAIDTETTGLAFDDRIIGIGIAWRDPPGGPIRSLYLNIGHPPSLFYAPHSEAHAKAAVATVLDAPKVFMHNAPFDLERLGRWGYLPRMPADDAMVCTQVGSRIAFPFAYKEQVTLEHMADRFFGGYSPEAKALKGARGKLWQMPAEQVDPYGKEDAVMTLRLGEKVLEAVAETYDQETGERLLIREGAFVKLLARMQLKGVLLDEGLVERKMAEIVKRIADITKECAEEGVHGPHSRKELLEALGSDTVKLLGHTEKGNVRLDAKSLSLVPSKLASAIVEWRSLDKARSTWLEGYIDKVASDGRLHPRFSSGGTISGRLSCSNPNLQAVPLEGRGHAFGALTGLLTAPDGWNLLAFDFKQAEMRLASAYAKSNAMARIFNEGQDVHLAAAQAMWPGELITDDRRQLGKRTNFTLMYGGGIKALSESCGIPPDEAKDLLNRHRRAYPQLNQTNQDVMNAWEARGWMRLLSGRLRWFGQWEKAYKGFNQLIQGGVAEVIKDAMLSVDKYLAEELQVPAQIVLQIHDSLEVETPEENSEELKPAIKALMTNSMPMWLRNRTHPPIDMGVDCEVWR